jgi:hypothetical protein
MNEIPLAAGLQILDADCFAKDIPRIYSNDIATSKVDALDEIEAVFDKLKAF